MSSSTKRKEPEDDAPLPPSNGPGFWSPLTDQMKDRFWLPGPSLSLLINQEPTFDRLAVPSWYSARCMGSPSCEEEDLLVSLSDRIRGSVEPVQIVTHTVSHQWKKRRTDEEPPAPKPTLKATKIRLLPNSVQRKVLLQWEGTARWTYNKCLDSIKKDRIVSKQRLRDMWVNDKAFPPGSEFEWVKETPYEIRSAALTDLLKAYQRGGDLKFRSKKRPSQTVSIYHKYWSEPGVFYQRKFLKMRVYEDRSRVKRPVKKEECFPLKGCESLPEKLHAETRLQRTRTNKFYLHVLNPVSVVPENQGKTERTGNEGVLSIDPGVRTFATCYDPSGRIYEWGKHDISMLYRLCRNYDDLQSRWNQKEVGHRKRWRMKRAGLRIFERVRNLVRDLHWNLANWICRNYSVVLLPKFETTSMVKRGRRKICSKTARQMLTWSHYTFRQRLLSKAREYPDCKIYLTSEAYTSKTCGRCGRINWDLGGSRVFWCGGCRYVTDRDWNGARNILLRFLTKNGFRFTGPC